MESKKTGRWTMLLIGLVIGYFLTSIIGIVSQEKKSVRVVNMMCERILKDFDEYIQIANIQKDKHLVKDLEFGKNIVEIRKNIFNEAIVEMQNK